MSLRARALEALRQAEEKIQAQQRADDAAERRRRSEKLRAVVEPWGVDVAEGADALSVDGLRLVAEPSRYGIVVVAGAACRECAAFARLVPAVTELRHLGVAYRALEALGDAHPCLLVAKCLRRAADVEHTAAPEPAAGPARSLEVELDRALLEALRDWLGEQLQLRGEG